MFTFKYRWYQTVGWKPRWFAVKIVDRLYYVTRGIDLKIKCNKEGNLCWPGKMEQIFVNYT